MITPCSRLSIDTLLLIGMNMLDVCEGAPPRRQALTLTLNSPVGLSRPCLSSLNTTSAVISLERLAGGTRSSADFSNSTLPLSASMRMACGAAVWKPSLPFGPETGFGAAKAEATAQARTAAALHLDTHEEKNLRITSMLISAAGRTAPARSVVGLASPALGNQSKARAHHVFHVGWIKRPLACLRASIARCRDRKSTRL